jgi:Na+-driven multidrug efflux pump
LAIPSTISWLLEISIDTLNTIFIG